MLVEWRGGSVIGEIGVKMAQWAVTFWPDWRRCDERDGKGVAAGDGGESAKIK